LEKKLKKEIFKQYVTEALQYKMLLLASSDIFTPPPRWVNIPQLRDDTPPTQSAFFLICNVF